MEQPEATTPPGSPKKKRRPKGSGTIRRKGSGFAIIYGPRGAQKYVGGFPTKTAALEHLILARAEALRPPPPPPPPPPAPEPRVVAMRSPALRAFKAARAHRGCEACGWVPPEPLSSRALHVHHVVLVSKGGDDSDANLVVLCPNHHALAHGARRIFAGLTTREAVLEALRRLDARAQAQRERLSAL